MAFTLHVNGSEHSIETSASESLLVVLHDRLGFTGTKYGCGEGQCGACTVLIDGQAVRSCITPAIAAENRKITTIEGLEQNGHLHPVQQAFLDAEAFQCGYCTSGMILEAVSLLDRSPDPSDADIVRHMNGNICRCGTYPRILAAIHEASAKKLGVKRG
jgi:aerobic-type carbon monoxide dehydrogenase small subunit (CoxS/CutS family)